MQSDQQVNVLLVDDRPENLLALEAILSSPEHNLVKARSGEEALRYLLNQDFAVILLDVQMPGMDGFETAALIRERERLRHTPIIFLTAITTSETNVFRGYSLGAVDYIFKPIVPEVLQSKVAVFVELFKKTQELQRQAEQLQAANKELESFSYSVSHDLRAPLRGIDGFSQALLEDYSDKLDEQGKHYLERLRSASQRMAQLIDDMLNLSRVTRSEMRRETVDLSAMAQKIALELQKTEPERQVKFVIAPMLVANGDARLLRIALENLLNNAWKFTERHPCARIEFGVTEQNGKSVYFVRDDGAGFDMEYADKLFGAFQRLHAATEFPGTGIGLATVQRIVRRHGGNVWAEAEVERGATFYFTL